MIRSHGLERHVRDRIDKERQPGLDKVFCGELVTGTAWTVKDRYGRKGR